MVCRSEIVEVWWWRNASGFGDGILLSRDLTRSCWLPNTTPPLNETRSMREEVLRAPAVSIASVAGLAEQDGNLLM